MHEHGQFTQSDGGQPLYSIRLGGCIEWHVMVWTHEKTTTHYLNTRTHTHTHTNYVPTLMHWKESPTCHPNKDLLFMKALCVLVVYTAFILL